MKSADNQIEDQNIVSFLPLDVQVEDSVNTILSHIDNMMQYGEDEEPKMPKDMDEGKYPWRDPCRFVGCDADYQAISIRTCSAGYGDEIRDMLYNHMHP